MNDLQKSQRMENRTTAERPPKRAEVGYRHRGRIDTLDKMVPEEEEEEEILLPVSAMKVPDPEGSEEEPCGSRISSIKS